MSAAELVRRMASAGATPEIIAIALDAVEAEQAKLQAIKDKAAAKKRAQREAAKVSPETVPGQSQDEAGTVPLETPSPPVSPLFPSPTPLTNNPPLSPPASEFVEAREPKSKRSKASRLASDWVLPADFMAWARAHRDPNHPGIQLTDEEIENEGHSIRDWSASSPNGAKLDWLSTWRGWIRRRAPEIIRARSRQGGTVYASRQGSPKYAPKGTVHDAFAELAGAAVSDPGPDPGRFEDYGDGPGAQRRSPVLEVLDFSDDRGAGARKSGGNREQPGPTLFALPAAAVR